MKTYRIIIIIFLTSLSVFSQSKKSIYRQNFIQGNYLLLERNYPLALGHYKIAFDIDSTNANINYKIGLCYLNSLSNKQQAVTYLEKAITDITHNYDEENPDEKSAPDMAYYSLAEAYRINYNFIGSYFYFKKFKEIVGNRNQQLSNELEKQMVINTNAQEFTKDTTKVLIYNLGDSINSIYPEYCPVISADESTLIFTSRRSESTGGEKTDDGQFMEDIYVSYRNKDKSWAKAKPISPILNTIDNEAAISISPNGKQLFVYKSTNGGDIYYSDLIEDSWGPLTPLSSKINTPNWETHACISADGNTLYFVSNIKEGGYGGRDIWKSVKLPNNEWSLPTNLGPEINTKDDEDAPFIHPDGVSLFFSSTGHKTMGGFDVFKSTLNENGKWSNPENLRHPINTPDDDIYYVQSADGKRAYISSIRKDSKGEKDIYRIDFERSISEALTLIKGVLTYNGENKQPKNAKITVTDDETNQLVQEIKPNEKTGKYIMILTPGAKGKTYNITFEAEGYQPISLSLVIPANSSYQEIEKEFKLQEINLESKTPGTMAVKGVVRDAFGKAIPGTMINIIDNKTSKFIQTVYTTADSGSYYFVVNQGNNYNVSFEAKNYLFHSENFNIPKTSEYSTFTKDIVLNKVEVGAKIVLNNIFFDSNKSNLRKESTSEINELIKLMASHPEIVIEVSGHTDNKGNDELNLALSQKRAQAVQTALVKKGIDIKRIIAKGYGKSNPVAPNSLPNGKPDVKGMQLNRRVELKIVS